MRHIFIIFLFLITTAAQAQRLSPEDRSRLNAAQDTLREMSFEVINARQEEVRQKRNDQLIPQLVNALKTKYSYYYPFDSVITMAKVYPKDSTFRIFTWPLENDNGTFRHFGVIQMNTKDGSLKLFPLFDNSDFMQNLDTVTSHKAWFGALYYAMIQQRFFNADYYTLFGWDANSVTSQKKVAEILTFNKEGEPVFGAPLFNFSEDTIPKPARNRFIIEYKRDAVAGLNFNPEMNMIVFDHLISETGEEGKKYTFIPDLDYEGFQWKAGKWMHVEKIFHDALQLGKFPVPEPLDKKKVNMMNPKTIEDIQAEESEKKAKKKKKN